MANLASNKKKKASKKKITVSPREQRELLKNLNAENEDLVKTNEGLAKANEDLRAQLTRALCALQNVEGRVNELENKRNEDRNGCENGSEEKK